jgi:hypothetical protein
MFKTPSQKGNTNQNYIEKKNPTLSYIAPQSNGSPQHNKQQIPSRMQGERNPHTLWVGMSVSAATVQSVQRFLKRLKIELPCDPAGHISELMLSQQTYRDTCTPMFIAALFTVAKLWKQPRCPTTEE